MLLKHLHIGIRIAAGHLLALSKAGTHHLFGGDKSENISAQVALCGQCDHAPTVFAFKESGVNDNAYPGIECKGDSLLQLTINSTPSFWEIEVIADPSLWQRLRLRSEYR